MRNTTVILFACFWLAAILVGCSGGSDSSYNATQPGFSSNESAPGAPPPPPPGGSNPNGEPYDLVFYENYGVNPFISTEDETKSTFGMDVDTASYTIARFYLREGNMPDKDSVRTEEFINYFNQDYPEPDVGVFSLTTEGAESQFGQPNYHLLSIGVKARDVSMSERPVANMVFVVDVSGSMNRQDRLEQVKRSLRMLAENLREGDRIGLVVYSYIGEVISDLTSNHNAIMNAIDELQPGGSTNAAEGLNLAYAMARENYEEGKINRIILCSDGVANVGTTSADEILEQVKDDAEAGITLTTLGFGMGNYNDVLMEKLANHGDGCYYYIDSDAEASRLFANGAVQMLMVLASDAKVQVEFNAVTIDRFRLLGYENRRLDEDEFEDDSVDAGEVGPGQTVTALYEMRIRDEAQGNPDAVAATVRIRYMNYETKEIETAENVVTVGEMTQEFVRATRRFRFTAGVAEFAEILKESYWAQDSTFSDVIEVVEGIAEDEQETEFVELVNIAIQLED